MLSEISKDNFINQNINKIQKKIESISYIKQVSIRKQWPDKLKIYLLEYVPIVRWNDNNFLDFDGISFYIPDKYVKKKFFPVLYGPERMEKIILSIYKNINLILSNHKIEFKSITMNKYQSIQLILKNNIKIELGRDQYIERIKCFTKIYPVLLNQAKQNNKKIIYIDLRYQSGLAVKWLPSLKNYETLIKKGYKNKQKENDQTDGKKNFSRPRNWNY